MTQWIKHLPCDYEDQNLDPQSTHKSQASMIATRNPSRWKAEDPQDKLASLELEVLGSVRDLASIEWSH